jgi:hypothetical protein
MREWFLKYICPWWGLRIVARNYTALGAELQEATKINTKLLLEVAYLKKVVADSHEVKRAKKAWSKQ